MQPGSSRSWSPLCVDLPCRGNIIDFLLIPEHATSSTPGMRLRDNPDAAYYQEAVFPMAVLVEVDRCEWEGRHEAHTEESVEGVVPLTCLCPGGLLNNDDSRIGLIAGTLADGFG
jgi:hypothetical protein